MSQIPVLAPFKADIISQLQTSMFLLPQDFYWGFSGGSGSKEFACNVGGLSLILGSRRSSREGNGNPLQYSCLDNSMDRGAWRAKSMASQPVRHQRRGGAVMGVAITQPPEAVLSFPVGARPTARDPRMASRGTVSRR